MRSKYPSSSGPFSLFMIFLSQWMYQDSIRHRCCVKRWWSKLVVLSQSMWWSAERTCSASALVSVFRVTIVNMLTIPLCNISSIVDVYLFNKETAKGGLKRKREPENLFVQRKVKRG